MTENRTQTSHVTNRKTEDKIMKNQVNARPLVVKALIWLLVLLAMGAFLGGGAFILTPDGHLIQMPFSHLQKSPFPNFLVPGLLLFTFLGIYPISVAYGMWRLPTWGWPDWINPFRQFHWSWAASLAAGVITIIWIIVEVIWVPFGLVHVLLLGWGGTLVVLTLHPDVRKYCDRHSFLLSIMRRR